MQTRFPEKIILASQSPRRHELLRQIGVEFELFQSEIDETVAPNELPQAYVERMAREKAENAWRNLVIQFPNRISRMTVLSADTSVIQGKNILGKPSNMEHAKQMLKSLSDSTHQVITSVALIDQQSLSLTSSITDVTFCELNDELIAQYIANGEGLDKAGSYGIQGIGAQFVKSINGSYSGVVGLPLYETSMLLDKHFKGKQ